MDRFELRKFLDEEQALALKWRDDAAKALREIEKLRGEFDEYVLSVGKSNLTDEEREQYKNMMQTLRDARDDRIFFEGVKKGMDAMAQPIRDRLAREELANAGSWVPKIVKPRRR